MTFDEFAPPFLLLEMHFESRARPDDEEDLFQRSWYRLFQRFHVTVWQAAVEQWIGAHKWMPKPVEMTEVCLETATRLVLEHEERQRRARIEAKKATADPAKIADLQARMRGLKDAMQVRPPAPGFHPRLEDYGDDDGR